MILTVNDIQLFGVTGRPVLHSKSPLMFNAEFDKQNSHYLRLACQNAGEAIDLFKKIGLKGMNVTAPFKNDIISFLDSMSVDAEKIGSVNTVVQNKDGLIGHNTDHIGVVGSIAALKMDMKEKKFLVIGAGGAASAAVFGLVNVGLDVTITNRTDEKATVLSKKFNCNWAPFSELQNLIKNSDVIISTIPVDGIKIEPEWLKPGSILFDAVYKDSTFESLAIKAKCKVITGEDWLYHQAVPAYTLFTGKYPDPYIMKENVWNENPVFKKRNSIALIGFMGCGKTTIGEKLAARLGYTFVDMDEMIEKKSGMKITEIFSKYGENYFRKLENELLIEHVYRRRIVVSFGGGVIERKENRVIINENMVPVWLYATISVCLSRIKKGTRPILDCPEPEKKATELFNARRKHYAKTAELVVDAEFEIEQVVDLIYEEINFLCPQ
ncbi:hypothetical protein KAJ27_06725 [bacterium]|nr:hypothetical protein [bacterium]